VEEGAFGRHLGGGQPQQRHGPVGQTPQHGQSIDPGGDRAPEVLARFAQPPGTLTVFGLQQHERVAAVLVQELDVVEDFHADFDRDVVPAALGEFQQGQFALVEVSGHLACRRMRPCLRHVPHLRSDLYQRPSAGRL
jgi:hypothetical protein